MELLEIVNIGINVDEVAFLISLLISYVAYTEYKKCETAIRNKEMIDNFLKE